MTLKRVALRSVQFQGANGFPIALYRPALSQIRSKVLTILDQKGYEVENASTFTIGGCDLFEHTRTGPDWSAMVKHLEGEVEKRRVNDEPLIFIGHSFGGGVLSALAAWRPDLVRGIILIEPPLFSFMKRFCFAFASLFVSHAMAEKYHPVIEASLRKKDVFSSVEAARQHLRSRRVFSTMDPVVFDIFINECLIPCCEDGSKGSSVQLLYDKRLEAEIYHRVPYDIPYLSKHILNQYGMTTHGKYYYTKHKTSILHSTDYNWVRNNFPSLQCIEYKETHFWPLEKIDDFSSVIAHDIVDMLVSDAA